MKIMKDKAQIHTASVKIEKITWGRDQCKRLLGEKFLN